MQAKGRLQPWNSKGWRPEGLVEAAARDLEGLRVGSVWTNAPTEGLRVWRLANGRLERPNNRGLCAGKGQAATLEQQRLTARGLGGSRAWWKPWTMWRPCPWQSRFHTSGCPRRRPCLGEGRGRRIICIIYIYILYIHIYNDITDITKSSSSSQYLGTVCTRILTKRKSGLCGTRPLTERCSDVHSLTKTPQRSPGSHRSVDRSTQMAVELSTSTSFSVGMQSSWA